jgi:hypothetical protein
MMMRALAERKLFFSPSTDFFADAFDGHAFASIKFGRGFPALFFCPYWFQSGGG